MLRIYYKLIFLFILFTGLITVRCIGQEPFEVIGVVQNEKGVPLAGISVSLEGVLIDPVITDSSGSFSIKSPSPREWLIVVPSGDYKMKRVYLDNRDKISVRLTSLDLVSVHDQDLNVYYAKPKRDNLSSSQTVGAAAFFRNPGQTVDESFQGNIAGSLAIHRSGMPASGMVNYIRGIKSMNTNNQPLYVIDGMPLEAPGLFNPLLDGNIFNPLTSLDPNDITSINILKDFTAGTAFGLRGTNGVVMIETLKPTEIRTIIDFSARTGITTSPQQIPQLDATQYKSLANELLMSSQKLEEDLPFLYPGLYFTGSDPGYYRYNHNTNWQNEVFSNSWFSDYYLRILGGDQIARYGLSVGYLDHNGIVKNTSYTRFNVRFVGTFTLFKWLRLYVSSNLTRTNSDLKESARVKQTSPILASLSKNPLMIPYEFDADGNQLKAFSDVDELGISNPTVIINDFLAKNKNYRFLTSFRMEGDITDHLKWNSLIGINLNTLDEIIFMPNHGMELYYDEEAFNVAKDLKDYLLAIYNDNNITYSREFAGQHQISGTGGIRINTNTHEEDWGIAKNSNENDEYRSLQSGTDYLSELGGQSGKWNRLGVYTQLDYIFRDRYLFHAGLVSETSTRIGKNAGEYSETNDLIMIGEVPFGIFYSLGGAWRISSESFLREYPWIEDMKLRLTYGTAGNDDIGNEGALRYYMIKHYRESSGMVPGNLSDRSLRFETGTQLNPGLDISLLAGRISLTIDYFSGRTDNMMVLEPLLYFAGYDFVAGNNGSVINTGWEASLFSRVIASGRFKLDAGFNISGFNNEILEISNDEIVTEFDGGAYISRKGESLLNFYGYVYEGVFNSKQAADEAGLSNERGIPFGAGDARFSDISGPDGAPDGIIDKYDKTLIGSPIPDLYGAAYTTISWGIWSLGASIQFVSGNEVFNYLRSQNEKMSDLSNQSLNVLKRWHYDGHDTDVPRASWGDPTGNSAFSSRWIEDGSYLRLKHVTLSCKIPEKFLVFRSAEFFLTGYNLITFSNYLGYDPEFAFSYNTMEQGIDYGLTPVTRKFMIGVKFGL